LQLRLATPITRSPPKSCWFCAGSRMLATSALRGTISGLRMQRRHLAHALGQIRLRNDRIPPVDALGLMAGELHRHGSRHPGSLEIADCRAP